MNINWLPIGDVNTPSTRIMCYNIHKWMNKNGIDSTILSYPYCNTMESDSLKSCDVIIFQKIFDDHVFNILQYCQMKGKSTIYILDDLYTDSIRMAQGVNKVVCGSEYIKSWIKPHTNAKLYVINDAYETSRDLYKDYALGDDEHKEVVWFGTLLHFPQAEALRTTIESLGYTYTTISACKKATKLWSLETIWNDIIDVDIVVIPYLGDLPEYELAKGNNRLTQAMILGLPVIASPIPAYKEIIRNGKNGFICLNNTMEEFALYLNLLKDRDLRMKIGKQAREDVIEKYSIDTIGREWIKILEV